MIIMIKVTNILPISAGLIKFFTLQIVYTKFNTYLIDKYQHVTLTTENNCGGAGGGDDIYDDDDYNINISFQFVVDTILRSH